MNRLPHPEPISGASYSAVELMPDNEVLVLLDQRQLPRSQVYLEIRDVETAARAIRDMVVRGAPAIGLTAAYAMVLAARAARGNVLSELERARNLLVAQRPTAVNLAWAADTLLAHARSLPGQGSHEQTEALAELARQLHREDVAANRRMGELGAERVPDGAVILTHCNAGALATGGYGTALGVIRAAVAAGKRVRVLADETRPYLQGSRLTAWELMQDGISVELIPDASAGWFFAQGHIDLAVVGADRIARNGDVANKIGTYSVACLARQHERPFYVAAPWSTVDVSTPSGQQIAIEERSPDELVKLAGVELGPEGVRVRNPAFDVTPARLVSAIFSERGVIDPVVESGVRALEDAAPSGRSTRARLRE
ncbi:MAG TPA: S-methyl-5-thioribose-1-phosphate isomerase [Polyangiaceae bacterium]|nr:S-methyl-5-thioribose-1-phosphate isomerase [Polyangiaceae bacterium]